MTTDEYLAIKFKHLKPSWLKRLNAKIGRLKEKNGGDGEQRIQWRKGHPHFDEWTIREILTNTELNNKNATAR